MKAYHFIILLFLVLSCENASKQKTMVVKTEIVIPNVDVLKNEIKLNGNEGNWYYKNKLFNGYMVTYHSNSVLEQRVGFYNGKKQGIAKVWFFDGKLKVESHYNQNNIVGIYRAWWPNGVLASEANYEDGELQGIEKKWYDSGQQAKQMHYKNGNEFGLQKAWLENGKLYVNYEAKNGRIFGMLKANLCHELKNEVVITK